MFDNRYQYDHIYPRGRSGETLRGVDTRNNNRPIVIKRPAPQDAPPLRAAQEVSIQTEKKALERLSGHPVLTALLGSGTFRAGGQTYTYIAMERAEGIIIEQEVLALARQGQRIPELELLAIVDQLLDLLIFAHQAHIIYNDVDAKHLFWNRETHQLKVIDWGNAIFKDEAGAPAGITAATDVHQMGELLYFMYQGGGRLQTDSSDDDYRVIFEQDLPEDIAYIITRATHPNTKSRRYSSLRALRQALDAYRQPMEQARNTALAHIQSALGENASQRLLEDLQAELEPVLAQDPSYPAARDMQILLQTRLRHLAVQADFDAARIYLETGNWPRAIGLMDELIPDADPYMAQALTFLRAATAQLQQDGYQEPPPGFETMLNDVLEGRVEQAAQRLMMQSDKTQLLIAEQMAVIMPGLTVLRPHIVRLAENLRATDSKMAREVEGLLHQLDADMPPGVGLLIERYGKIAIRLIDWMDVLERAGGHIAPAERAEDAARTLIDHLRRILETAYTNPKAMDVALRAAQQIDPTNPHIAEIPAYLSEAERSLNALGTFKPREDGSGLPEWLSQAQEMILPYSDITDERFQLARQRLPQAYQQWIHVQDMLALGQRTPTLEILSNMQRNLRNYNTHVADWLDSTMQLVRNAQIIERLSPNQALGDTLLRGYQAWDRGQSGKAAEAARNADSLARTEGERLAVQRLRTLADITNQWLIKGGTEDADLTDTSQQAAYQLLLPEEQQAFETFSRQMPREETYLAAMTKFVDTMRDSSTAGFRALFLYYAWRGMLSILDGNLGEADFWQQAAHNTIGKNELWASHPVYEAVEGALRRRQWLIDAEAALNSIRSWEDAEALRQDLDSPQGRDYLREGQIALSAMDDATRKWSDGDFRAARNAITKAQESLTAAEESSGVELSALKAWVAPHYDTLTELLDHKGEIEQAVMVGSSTPDRKVLQAFEQMVSLSEAAIGSEHARQMQSWLNMYRQMVAVHQNQRLSKREKLNEFDTLFTDFFIAKHPAYQLFERWQTDARNLPEDVQEELQISIDEDIDTTTERPEYVATDAEPDAATSVDTDEDLNFDDPYAEDDRRARSWNRIIIVSVLILIALGALGVVQFFGNQSDGSSTIDATATRIREAVVDPRDATATRQQQITQTPPTNTPLPVTHTPTATQTIPPTNTPPTPQAPAVIDVVPSNTPLVPTIAPTLTPTQAVTIVTNTPPVVAQENVVDVLGILDLVRPEDFDWDPLFFNQGAGAVWQLGASVEDAGSAPIVVSMEPAFLNSLRTDAATRLERVDVSMELTFFNDQRILSDQVFFGVALENESGQRYGTQVQLQQADVVSFGVNANGNFSARSQLPLQRIAATLSLERQDDGTIVFFVDGQRLGVSPSVYEPGEPVTVVLYNAGGGMFVTVDEFSITLSN